MKNNSVLIRISNLLFYLTLLFLPTQFGKHFWPEFSFVYGLRVDYLSPTIYLTDILIGFLFFVWFISRIKSLHNFLNIKYHPFDKLRARISNIKKSEIENLKLVLLVVFLLVGVVFSKNPQAGFYGLVKFFEYLFLGIYVARNVKNLKPIVFIFSLGIFFEGLLATLQYLNQGSLGGLLYFFGERTFNTQTPGIANVSLNGNLVLRPYGTFPHPNVLGGYMTIAMAIVISNITHSISSGQISRPRDDQPLAENIKKIIYLGALLVGTVGLFLTLSRVAIVLWMLILVLFLIRNLFSAKNKKIILTAGCLSLITIMILFSFTPLRYRFIDFNFLEKTITRRIELINASLLMVKESPIIGVGINSFLVNLPEVQKPNAGSIFEYLQPVHNIYLLILSETGSVGLIFFLWFIYQTLQQIKNQKSKIKNKRYLLLIILILGIFDHYFLTLQQGQLLFSLILGLCWQSSTKIKNKRLKYIHDGKNNF